MGGGNFSSTSWSNLKQTNSTKTKKQLFTSTGLANDMSPFKVKFRESRDSANHPESLAVCVFLDETGSMGEIPHIIATEKLGALIETLIKHGIEHPAVLFGGIGDHVTDQSPLQVGQFESAADELNKWLTKIYLEANGGGQGVESYSLAWLFAARHTSIDCFEKRGQKGFLFTIGDEGCWNKIDKDKLKALMGYDEAQDVTDKQLLAEVQRTYHVFHIHCNQTGHRNDPRVIDYWKDMLGERLIILEDYNDTAEVIASTIAVIHGIDLQDVVKGFNSKTAGNVTKALAHITTGNIQKQTSGAKAI